MADQWLSIVEYARYFNISDMTVRRRIKTGKIQAILREGKYYIPLEPAGGGDELDYPPSFHQASPRASELYSSPQRWSASERPQQQRPRPREFGHQRPHQDLPQHPSPQHHKRPYVQRDHIPVQPKHPRPLMVSPPGTSTSPLPEALSAGLNQQNTVMLESKALLSFCESVLLRLNEAEKRMEGDFKNQVATLEAKTKSLEAQLNAKEIKVNELQQQVEDLQLLVKIIEKQKSAG